jgi:hypothetical protein
MLGVEAMIDEQSRGEQRKRKSPGQAARLGNFKVTLPGGLAVSGSGVIGLLIVGVIVLLGVFLVPRMLASDTVYTEPIEIPGTNGNPFMPSVGNDQRSLAAPPGTGGIFVGNTSGLYGGTLNKSNCDRQAMTKFLQAYPDKGAAWSETQGITQADLPRYISGLTAMLLRSDTSVTNHGFSDGHSTTLHSVLQAGTAVLVDKYGVPRARCYCGNPLTPPTSTTAKRYVGPTWSGFSPASITTIKPTAAEITEFSLVDPRTREVFYRLAGTAGEQDRPQTPLPSASIPETPPSVSPKTPESSPEPLPQPEPNTVPSGFIGTWTGSVTQDNSARSPYPVTVQITSGGVGQTVATGQYPSLECQVHWTLKQASPGEIVIRETVDQGPECVPIDVTLTLLDNRMMRYTFDGGLGRSVLQRVS